MSEDYIGVDIGGTKCAVVLGNKSGEIKDKIKMPTDHSLGPEGVIGQIIKAVHEISERNGLKNSSAHAIGISCGGPLDSRKGLILSPPNLPGWDSIPITEILTAEFKCKVSLQNDANAGALAEWKFGAGKGYQHIIFLTFGTGMGAGLILNGQLYSGINDMAGEVGHVRIMPYGPAGYGKKGSFEGFCSGGGIAQFAQTEVLRRIQNGEIVSFVTDIRQISEITALSVAEAAMSGDPVAKEIFADIGTFLGEGLSMLIDILNPELIIIGSIYARSGALLQKSMHKKLVDETLGRSLSACKIVPARLGEHIGDLAALAVAML